jgi:DNA-binding XRE family transcriptional regulator
MCLDLGLSKSTMSDMKSGRKSGVSMPTAQKIAGYFGITVDELYGKNEEKPTIPEDSGLTENQRLLMDFAKSVPDDKAAMILKVIQSIVEAD